MAAPSTLQKRREFLAVAATGRRWVTKNFIVQAKPYMSDAEGAQAAEGGIPPARIGYTVTKKVGNAVRRNRAKRRLREIGRLYAEAFVQPGWDYVLIARAQNSEAPFEKLAGDLKWALKKIHAGIDLETARPPSNKGQRRKKGQEN